MPIKLKNQKYINQNFQVIEQYFRKLHLPKSWWMQKKRVFPDELKWSEIVPLPIWKMTTDLSVVFQIYQNYMLLCMQQEQITWYF